MIRHQGLHALRRLRRQYTRILWSSLWTPPTVFLAVVGNVILIGAVFVFHWLEADVNTSVDSWIDSLWWGLATVTTVGFGDVVPITDGGRLIGMFLMLAGVCMFVGFTALVASGFSATIQEEIVASERISDRGYDKVLEELTRIDRRLDELAKRLDGDG